MKQPPWPQETPYTAKPLRIRYLGTQVPYMEAMAQMKRAMENVDLCFSQGGGFELLLLEHRDTITTTRQHGRSSFLKPIHEIEDEGIEIIETDRGGDVTFHGPGQLVGYLVMRLPSMYDVLGYVRALERALLHATWELGLTSANTLEGKTGIWLSDPFRKLIAIGVGTSKGVTRHGFALNISTDLEKFTRCIIPCGLKEHGVTSLDREMCGRGMQMPSKKEIGDTVIKEIAKVFALNILEYSGQLFETSDQFPQPNS